MSAMRPDAIPRKTERGRQALGGREFPGTRAQRLFLIMVDGHKSLRELAAAAEQLRLDGQALRELVDRGLMDWAPPARASAPKPPAPAAGHPAGATEPRDGAGLPQSTGAVPEEGRAPRSLAAAKMYALDLAALMLRAQDAQVRESARDVADGQALQAWLLDVARRITVEAGVERAATFLEKVGAVLPDGMAPAWPLDAPAPAPAQ